VTVLDDTTVLTELEEPECLRLLASQAIGRVGLVTDGRPTVLPVHYVLIGRLVVVRTATGSWFDRIARGAHLAFEIDHADPAYHTGWSVLCHGIGVGLEGRLPSATLDALPLRPWGFSTSPGWIGIQIDELSGRRIVQIEP
jgi:uncharacterized protein